MFIAAMLALGLGQVDDQELEFWSRPERAKPAAAAQLVLARHPLTAAVLRDAGFRWSIWGNELAFAGNEAPPLNPAWLESIKDRDGRPMPDISGRPFAELPPSVRDYYNLYCQALEFADRVPVDAFAESAKENAHVTFAHMYEEPWKYRGKVIPIEGRLKRLRKLDAPEKAQQLGIKFIYEAWIFGPTYGANPITVIFTNPGGLKEAENMKPERSVTFYGYFINRIKYRDAAGKERDTPFLIGPTLILSNPPAAAQPAETGMSSLMSLVLYGVVGTGLFVAGLMIGLSFWYRRSDAQVRSRLAQIQASRTVEMLENHVETPAERPNPPSGSGFDEH